MTMQAVNPHASCVVCGEGQVRNFESSSDSTHQSCQRCGEFIVSGTVEELIKKQIHDEKIALLSGWIHQKYRSGEVPVVNSDNLPLILSFPVPSITERARNLLIEAKFGQNQLSVRFDVNEPRFMAATYSSMKEDLFILMNMLENFGYIEHRTLNGSAHISPSGLVYLDEFTSEPALSSKGFVAMSFNPTLSEAYSKGIEVGVLQSGYNPIRVDQVEHINRIDDEIIAQIKSSKFMVADFTDHRGGVYFEAGFAMGLDKPIFWTCRKDHMKDLHFDIRQFNCIDWDCLDDLANRLSMRIQAVVGPGPGKVLE